MESEASELCQSCALCCDGALFGWVALEPDEAARFHLPLIGETGQLEQPCTHLEGTRCGIYEGRPRDCARFRCNLLLKLDASQIALSQALSTVARAKALRDELIRALPEGQGFLWARISREDPKGYLAKGDQADIPEWIFVAGALRGLLGREFSSRYLARKEEPA